MKYSIEDLYSFMDSRRAVRVTSTSGKSYEGPCWAYSAVVNEEEDGVAEDSLEVGSGGEATVLYAREIEQIEFAD